MPDTPTFEGVIGQVIEQASRELDSCKIGRVESWDKDEQTAQIQPVIRSEGEALPVIPDCPVLFPGARWDLQAGSFGLLLVVDDSFQRWWRTGEDSDPENIGTHDLGNAVFVPGLNPSTGSLNLGANSTVLEKPGTGGAVQLGTWNAFKAVVHEDAFADILTWAGAVSAAITGLGGDVTGALATLSTNLPTRKSPSVYVED